MIDDLSWHPIQLPSLGRYYGGKLPNGLIEITPWTTSQEEAIVNHSNDPSGRSIIDKLLERNVRYPDGFTYPQLLVTDQHYILMKLRAISITCIYHVDHICPSCGNSHEVKYNIDELPRITPKDEASWDEPFDVVLPNCGWKVEIRHLRVSDIQVVEQYRKQKENSPFDDTFILSTARKIVSVNGDNALHINDKKEFIRRLVKIDLDVLRRWTEKFETGLDINVSATCSKCGHRDKWDLPLQSCFFRPKGADIEAAVSMANESRTRNELPSQERVYVE